MRATVCFAAISINPAASIFENQRELKSIVVRAGSRILKICDW